MSNSPSLKDQQDSDQNLHALMSPQDIKADILKRLSRRNWLRNAAITATGAVLLPSFLTGCTKEHWDEVIDKIPGGGLGSELPVVPTQAQLEEAAKNINNMRALIADLYDKYFKYDVTVLGALNSTEQNESWNEFVAEVFTGLAIGLAEAALPEVAGPAIAVMGHFTSAWHLGKDRPLELNGVNGFFSEYLVGQQKMAHAIDKKLGHYSDENKPANDYANLKAAWNEKIEFNGVSDTLGNLASTYFPTSEHNSDAYNKIFEPMELQHRKAVWNLVIMKCCTYYENFHYRYVRFDNRQYRSITDWAQEDHYKNYPGTYARAIFRQSWEIHEGLRRYTVREYEVIYYNLGIGGNPFPESAIKELFIDDTPYHAINSNGLFYRNYVFKQFSTKKQPFLGQELGRHPEIDFSPTEDYADFTGGMFPELIEP